MIKIQVVWSTWPISIAAWSCNRQLTFRCRDLFLLLVELFLAFDLPLSHPEFSFFFASTLRRFQLLHFAMTLTCLDWWLWWLTLGILSSFHSWARLAWADFSSSQGRRVMTSLSSVASRTSLRSRTRCGWRFLAEVQPCSVESNRQGRGLADWVRHW